MQFSSQADEIIESMPQEERLSLYQHLLEWQENVDGQILIHFIEVKDDNTVRIHSGRGVNGMDI